MSDFKECEIEAAVVRALMASERQEAERAWRVGRNADPEPYVPQVGDVVEWTEDEFDGADVLAGDRGTVVADIRCGSVDVRPDDMSRIDARFGVDERNAWAARPGGLRLIERPAMVPDEHRVGDVWRRTHDSPPCTVCDVVVGGARVRYADGSISGPHSSPKMLMKLGWKRTHREDGRAAPPARPADDRFPHRCDRGHRAYVGLGAVECPTCDAISEVATSEPPRVGSVITIQGERRWFIDRTGYHMCDHPTRDGAVALWRAAEVARLHAEGRA